jgi:hypothetical protein
MTVAHCKPVWESEEGEIHQMDAIKLVGQLPSESVDLVITN